MQYTPYEKRPTCRQKLAFSPTSYQDMRICECRGGHKFQHLRAAPGRQPGSELTAPSAQFEAHRLSACVQTSSTPSVEGVFPILQAGPHQLYRGTALGPSRAGASHGQNAFHSEAAETKLHSFSEDEPTTANQEPLGHGSLCFESDSRRLRMICLATIEAEGTLSPDRKRTVP